MLLTLLTHQWKADIRSSVFQKSVALNIIMGLLILYFGGIFLFLGFNIDDILLKVFPSQDPVAVFNGGMLYYFLMDLFFRFMLQEMPVLAVQPYLHLPVGKNKLVHFVLVKSVFSFLNVLPLLFMVPFMVSAVMPAYGVGIALVWLLALVALTLFNNFVLLYFKRQLAAEPLYTLAFGVVVSALMLLDYFDLLSLNVASRTAFGQLLLQPWLVAVPLLLVAVAYTFNFRFLKEHTYAEELQVRKATKVSGSNIAFLSRFGEIGKLIELELKLIWRNKRPKSTLFTAAFILFYGVIFYKEPYMDGYAMLIFVGLMMTGMAMFSYGQFVPGWQSTHFDALLTQRISIYQFLKAKYWMFLAVTLFAYLITLPYGLLGYKILIINTVALLYNIGVNVFIIFYFSAYNTSRLDLSRGSAFNWQGVGASKFVMMLPLIIIPLLIYMPFGLMDVPYVGLATIGGLGLLGLIFQKQLLQWSARWFMKHKYKLATGFRQSE